MVDPPPLNRIQTYRNIGLLFGCEALTRTWGIIVLTTMGLAGRGMYHVNHYKHRC